jgi:hypothetical protein
VRFAVLEKISQNEMPRKKRGIPDWRKGWDYDASSLCFAHQGPTFGRSKSLPAILSNLLHVDSHPTRRQNAPQEAGHS